MSTISIKRVSLGPLLHERRALWDGLRGSRYRFWLDSGGDAGGDFLAAFAWGDPLWVFQGRNGRGVIRRPGRSPERVRFTDPTAVLRDLLRGLGAPGRSGFAGGAAGYWGYECAGYFEARKGPAPAGSLPDFVWVMPRYWAVWGRDGATLLLQREAGDKKGYNLTAWRRKINSLPGAPLAPASGGGRRMVPAATLAKNRARYLAGVRRIKRYIAAGDIYQANLTHRLDFPWPARREPADFFEALRRLNPSPYSMLMDFGRFSLAGCSPELLLRVEGGRVATRPIAGTRPRGATAATDRKLSGELLLSPKERAEHVMLLDLERNDLGRVCRPGSVRVSENMVLEKYSHVAHIVSQVEGRLAGGRDGFDAVKAVFPGGTITGCPKRRCMEILEELEGGPRGPFFGGAGWAGPGGATVLNILIRTALFAGGKMALRVGAGIVADSRPAKEYEETLHKARALVKAYERTL